MSEVRREIGRRVRVIREVAGVRQEEVAAAARRHGLAWRAPQVSALERGNKAISVEQMLMLPLVLTAATGRAVCLEDLLPKPPSLPACEAFDESEWRAARKLSISVSDLRARAVQRWGRTLPVERDARAAVAAASAGASRRSVQAIRGRLTRDLVRELAELQQEVGHG